MPIFVRTAERFAVEAAEFVALEPAITRWHRLEANPVALDLSPGLEARIADPLWLVGRQWQLAELKGEDAGTPARVELEGEKGPIRYPKDAARGKEDLAGPRGLVEPVVEAELVRADRRSLAAEAGLDFERALSLHGAKSLAPAFRKKFPFAAPDGFDPSRDPSGARFLTLTAGRAIDGAALAAALKSGRGAGGAVTRLPAGITAAAATKRKALAAASDWLALWEALLFEPSGASDWRDSRLEYAFALEAELSAGTTALAADEYHGGRLDWWTFDAGATLAPDARPAGDPVRAVGLPVPIRYPGMPADRYWQFEDGSVNLADPKGGPASIAMMLVLEYELVASNDWFHVPLDLDYGHAFRLDRLRVTDTFGRVAEVPRAGAGQSGWAMFELTPRSDGRRSPALFVLPSVTAEILESPPLEEVVVFRDEMANLVWGVERRVPGVTVASILPLRDTGEQVLSQQLAEFSQIDAAALYRLQSPVPPNWFPFTAETAAGATPGTLMLSRRNLRRMVLDADGRVTEVVERPRGRILLGQAERFDIDEREVPRSGLVLSRTFQHARTADGGRVVWLGRRKRVGRGEGVSDLRYDILHSIKRE